MNNLEHALETFPASGRKRLAEIVQAESFAGVIGAADAQLLCQQLDKPVESLMLALVAIARVYAFPPISNFHVGAIVAGSSGDLIFGANLEFSGMALNVTVHAEQAAVFHAFQLGERGITAIAVNGSPCGHCRQFLAEINNPEIRVTTPKIDNQPLHALLPDAFTPASLDNPNGLLDPVNHDLTSSAAAADDLVAAALAAANHSYAPYSQVPAGVAIRTQQGSVISASYLENVAFNPSLSPLHGVLIAMRMQGIEWDQIQEAVLVERKTQGCSQRFVTENLLASLGEAPLRILHL